MKQKMWLPLVLLVAGSATQAGARGLTVDDMLAMQRVGAPVVSPDGKNVAFTVRDTDVQANRGRFDIWLAAVDGSGVRRLTAHPDNDTEPAWSSDGKWLYFLSARGGSQQVWRIAVGGGGGEAEQVTRVAADVGGFKLFPDNRRMVLAIEVWPNARTLAESNKLDDDKAKATSKARIYDELLMRHWDTWEDGKYSHLFVWEPRGELRDLTPGQTTDSPTHPHGGMEEVTISPDGKTVLFVARTGGRETAWRTNTEVFAVPATGGARTVLTQNPAYDYEPTYSPDGKTIAVRMMVRPGYEADRERIGLYDAATKKLRVLTEAWDRSATTLAWSADGKTLYTSADNVGNHALFAIDAATGAAKPLLEKGFNATPRVAGDRLVFARDTFRAPTELFTIKPDGSDLRQITHFNDARVKTLEWGETEQYSFKGAKGDTVYGFAMKPAGFRGGKAPVVLLIHGGPQGSFSDHFHYRWNAQAFAGRGYAVVIIDFHGSTGYGQSFTDAINGDWGGAPFQDLMLGMDAALAKYPWMDGTRQVAAGASYGGYMINWINGHTNRFKALVCHDGNLDERMAYYDTEELWFPEWERGGTPWAKPEAYSEHNPIDHVKDWKTPTLVIHGGLDFRVVDTQGMSTFTALQRKGIPSRFIHFPDENHWVLKPQNSKLWHDQVLGWLDKYTGRK